MNVACSAGDPHGKLESSRRGLRPNDQNNSSADTLPALRPSLVMQQWQERTILTQRV